MLVIFYFIFNKQFLLCLVTFLNFVSSLLSFLSLYILSCVCPIKRVSCPASVMFLSYPVYSFKCLSCRVPYLFCPVSCMFTSFHKALSSACPACHILSVYRHRVPLLPWLSVCVVCETVCLFSQLTPPPPHSNSEIISISLPHCRRNLTLI